MSLSDIDLLRHIYDEVDFVLRATNGKTQEQVINNEVLIRAIVRSLEIIGEASKKVGEEYKAAHPQIEWKKMSRTRNKLIHDYFGVDYDIVWDIIQSKLPELKFQLQEIFNT